MICLNYPLKKKLEKIFLNSKLAKKKKKLFLNRTFFFFFEYFNMGRVKGKNISKYWWTPFLIEKFILIFIVYFGGEIHISLD